MDTDIGVDCDDAAALGLLLNYQSEGKCEILAITTSTAREGAVSAVKSICDYYGAENIPVGKMSAPALACDNQNNYALALMERYGAREEAMDAVALMRKTLAAAEEKVTLVSIGPSSNIALLLLSSGDGVSPLSGVELVAQKVEALYLMGGAFESNYDGVVLPKRAPFAEWNILQDISAARTVAEKCPCPMLYCPFEAGHKVYTYLGRGENPVWYSMLQFADKVENNKTGENFRRMSWDPVTCMVAVEGTMDFYELSPDGRIQVDERGITTFSLEGKGHRYLQVKDTFADVSAYLNERIERK